MRRLMSIPIILIWVAGCQSSAKLSIVGEWETTWSGDTHGVETRTFVSDGTYRQKSDAKIDSRNYHFVEEHSGSYTFNDNVLTITATGKLDSLNPDGSILRHSELKSLTTVEKVYGMTNKQFTITNDPAMKLDTPDSVYKKK